MLVYGTEVGLETADRPGVVRGVATISFVVYRADAREKVPMLLCDGCTGAALKAVCESVLQDMETHRASEECVSG